MAASRTASTKRIDTSRVAASPLWRQPWIVSCWPNVTQLCTTSCEPKPCEPESSRPAASNRPRSQSLLSAPAERTVTKPDIGAV